MIVTREQSIAWLKPMLNELGINVNAIMNVNFDPDEIVITCVYSEEPDAEFPPSVLANQIAAGLDDFSVLLYQVCLEIVDVEADRS